MAFQTMRRNWLCLALSGLTGCVVEKPVYQPYFVIVPYTLGTDPKTSEDAARQVIERLKEQMPNMIVQAAPVAEPVPFPDRPKQNPITR